MRFEYLGLVKFWCGMFCLNSENVWDEIFLFFILFLSAGV